jgi:NTE family protein
MRLYLYMTTALVLSAGGMWAAWEVGAWSVLREHVRPELIVGASGGAFNGWAIAGGATPDDLRRLWLDKRTGDAMRDRPNGLYARARELFELYPAREPFALTIVEVPSMRSRIVREKEMTWRHLAATAAIPCVFPPVEIDGHNYVDGGLRAGLPLWAAEELGATRAIALNVLNTPLFRFLYHAMRGKRPGAALEVIRIEPRAPLGTLHDALVWNANNVERWIEMGERDALAALSSVRM